MVFKNPFTVANLAEVKAQIYVKALKKILNEKLEDGETVPFLILFNHVYKGFDEKKSAMFPFLVLGALKDGNAWKEFSGKVLGGKKQKEFMVMGSCTRQGDHLLLTVNTKGVTKIPPKILTNLQKLIKKINPKITIGIKEGVKEEETVVGAAGAAVGGSTPTGKTENSTQETASDKKEKPEVSEKKKEKLLKKYKKEKQDEAKKLGEQFDELNSMSSSDAIKKVTANIKRGRTTKKDLKAVKALNKVYSTTEKLYKGTAKQIQQKFDKPYK
jgi:hypothetical protein